MNRCISGPNKSTLFILVDFNIASHERSGSSCIVEILTLKFYKKAKTIFCLNFFWPVKFTVFAIQNICDQLIYVLRPLHQLKAPFSHAHMPQARLEPTVGRDPGALWKTKINFEFNFKHIESSIKSSHFCLWWTDNLSKLKRVKQGTKRNFSIMLDKPCNEYPEKPF